MEFDPELISHRLRITEILFGCAILTAIILFPIFHKEAGNPVARFE